MSESDSIFNSPTITNLPTTQIIGGGDISKLANSANIDDIPLTPINISTTPIKPINVPSNLINESNPSDFHLLAKTVPIEPIGIPVYLSGIIQLLSVIILLSKNKTRQASIQFFSIGIYMLTVHCAYAGKSNTLSKGQFNSLCRNFSYLLVVFPLISVIMVLVDDFENAWKNIKYNAGKIHVQLPTFSINKNKNEEENEIQV